MENRIDRRSFLKGAALLGAGSMAVGLAGCASEGAASAQAEETVVSWDEEYEVVIVGGGGTGFCAAIEAAEAGASVKIIEKNSVFGGSTGLSGGMILGADTDWQRSLMDYDSDTGERFAEQQLKYGCGLIDEEIVTEMCLKSSEAVQFMTDLGRVYSVVDIVPPIWAYDTDETWAPRSHWDPAAQGGHFNCLQTKVDSLSNIETENNVEGKSLVLNSSNEVIGVEAEKKGKPVFIKAKKAVILATAGIDDDIEMAKRLHAQQHWGDALKAAGHGGTTGIPTNTGDGIRMGLAAGADLDQSQACVMATTGYHGGVGTDFYSTYEHTPNPYMSTSIIGEILVNAQGNRFVQEDADWGYVCSMTYKECVKTGADPAGSNVYNITDADHVQRWEGYGIPAEFEGATIEELAADMGVPAEQLRATVDTWNEYAAAGVDPDFGRRTDFAPIANGPFYAFTVYCSSMGAAGGLRINNDTQVLDVNGEVIPRLYAAGMCAGGWIGPFYPGCGWAVLGTVHLGRKAGMHAASLDSVE